MTKSKTSKQSSTKGRSAAKTVFACRDCGAQRHRSASAWIQGQPLDPITLDQDPGEMKLERWGTGLTELEDTTGRAQCPS